MDKEKIKKHFSKSAPNYDRFSRMQRRLGLDILQKLKEIVPPRTILDLGSGTGFLAYKLAKKYPKAKVVALDIAPGMIKFAKEHRLCPNIIYKCIDVEKMSFKPHSLDLIVSNASLQWTDLLKVSKKVKPLLKKEGRFIFTTFGPQTLVELKAAFRKLSKDNPVHTFPSLSLVKKILKQSGFLSVGIKRKLVRQKVRNAQTLMQSLKGLGALSAKSYDPSFKRAKDLLAVMGEYNRQKSRSATYEVFFCRASEI